MAEGTKRGPSEGDVITRLPLSPVPDTECTRDWGPVPTPQGRKVLVIEGKRHPSCLSESGGKPNGAIAEIL